MEVDKDTKKVRRFGATLWVPLDRKFVESHNIRDGDKVDVYFDEMYHVRSIDKEKLAEAVEKAKEPFEEEF